MSNPATPSEAMNERLTVDPPAGDLSALIGDRAFPCKPTQEAELPYLAWWEVSGGGGTTMSGPTRLKQHEMRVEAYAATEDEAVRVLAAARLLLAGWRDRNRGVQGCFESEDADQESLDDGVEVAGQTFRLWFAPQL